MLWRVQGTDKYFLSSLHFLPEGDSELDLGIWDLLPHMSRVVFEADLSIATQPEYATYQNGCQLHEVLPTELYATCTQRWGEFHIAESLDLQKPWWAAMRISVTTILNSGYSLERGVERQLLAKVPPNRRTYLEIANTALLPFEQSPLSEQISFLQESLRKEVVMAEMTSLYDMWRASDLRALSQLFDRKMGIHPLIWTGLINERNARWALQIIEFLADPTPTLFVLGALHYVGPHKFPDCLNGSCEYVFQKVC